MTPLRIGEVVMWAEAPYRVVWEQGGLVWLTGLAYQTSERSYRAREDCTVLASDVRRVGEGERWDRVSA